MSLIFSGAGKGSRTPISTLARSCNSHYTIPAFAKLSAGRPASTLIWHKFYIFLLSFSNLPWVRMESNHRPSDYESPALTAELRTLDIKQEPVPGGRIELPTQRFSVFRSTTELPRPITKHLPLSLNEQKNQYLSCVGSRGLEPLTLSV